MSAPAKPKTSAPAAAPKPDQAFVLFAKNIEKIRLFYARQKTAGPSSYGINTVMQEASGLVSAAAEMALAGKEWEPL